MSGIAIAARLFLCAVFVTAALTKLADRGGTRKAVHAFGAPERFAGTIAIAIPVAELMVAGLLLPATSAPYGALGALALLALFSGTICWNLARGRTPDCHCFGQLHSAPASRRTVARNAGLAALAVIALVGSIVEPASALGWIADLEPTTALTLLFGVVAVSVLAAGTAAFVTLMRSHGRALVRLDRVETALADAGIELSEHDAPRVGLEPGTEAPWFLVNDTTGAGVSRDDLLVEGKHLLLLFTSPHCGPCAALLPQAVAWQREHAETLTVAFASSGSADTVGAEAEEFVLEHVLVDESGALHESFHANGTPSAVLIDAAGRIASWVASGRDEIEALADVVVAHEADEGLPVGAEAPLLELPTLDGETISLDALRGRETLLLFWNPDCGYCRSMHDDVLAWEASTNGHGPRLVVVSSGDEENTRADRFRSAVVLDREFAAGAAFGANGTPMAVLLDSEGRIASPVVAGANAVLELAGARSLA
jgi:thiol-disulfide isomerase/thioredoxin